MVDSNVSTYVVLFSLVALVTSCLYLWRSNHRSIRKRVRQIFPREPRVRFVGRAILLTIVLIGLAIGLSNPVVHREEASSRVIHESTVVFILDTSLSMEARPDSESPDRLSRGEAIIEKLIPRLGNPEVALITFTESPVWRVPPTRNYGYVQETLNRGVDTRSTPNAGSNFSKVLEAVFKEFKESEKPVTLVLITDGEYRAKYPPVFSPDMMDRIRDSGFRLVTVGIGDSRGESIPLFDSGGNFTGEYETLSDGSRYVSYFDGTLLKEFARVSGGKYFSEGDDAKLASYLRGEVFEGDSLEEPTPYGEDRDISKFFFALSFFSFLALWALFYK